MTRTGNKMAELNNLEKQFGVINCPNRKFGLQGDFDNSYSCFATGSPDADSRGFGYDLCTYVGDYRQCPIFKNSEKRK